MGERELPKNGSYIVSKERWLTTYRASVAGDVTVLEHNGELFPYDTETLVNDGVVFAACPPDGQESKP